MWLGQHDLRGSRIDDVHPFDEIENRSEGRFEGGILDPLQSILDIGGVEGAAIMEGNAGLERDGPFGGGVIGGPGRREFRCGLAIVVLADQSGIDHVVHFVEAGR